MAFLLRSDLTVETVIPLMVEISAINNSFKLEMIRLMRTLYSIDARGAQRFIESGGKRDFNVHDIVMHAEKRASIAHLIPHLVGDKMETFATISYMGEDASKIPVIVPVSELSHIEAGLIFNRIVRLANVLAVLRAVSRERMQEAVYLGIALTGMTHSEVEAAIGNKQLEPPEIGRHVVDQNEDFCRIEAFVQKPGEERIYVFLNPESRRAPYVNYYDGVQLAQRMRPD